MFRLVTCLLGASFACLPKNVDVEKMSMEEIKELVKEHWPETADDDMKAKIPQLTQKSHPMMKQLSEELKNELTANIMTCLITRRNPMRSTEQNKLGKTEWFSDWHTHCGQQVDPACPGRMGECWAMGVLMCRKNCDAKFILRGNRKKFKRCIFRELRLYEKSHPDTVEPICSVLDMDPNLPFDN